MSGLHLTPNGQFLKQSLDTIAHYETVQSQAGDQPTLNVPNVGSTFIMSYEQLRSVAENIEDHLLTQAAIRRFLRRNLVFTQTTNPLARELVIELTQAGYLKNNTTELTKITQIDTLIDSHLLLRNRLAQTNIPQHTYDRWLFDLLSVQIEQLLNNPLRILSFAHFAHRFFSDRIDYSKAVGSDSDIPPSELPKLLYIAIHKELLKSNDANARSGLMQLYKINLQDIHGFITFNQAVDTYAAHPATARLSRVVAKNGAPLHVIKTSYFEKQDDALGSPKIESALKTETFIESNIDRMYKAMKRTVTAGVIKSIMFLLLAYAVIGLVVQLPFEIITTGQIQTLPLVVNLVLPILFLVISVVSYKKPAAINKETLQKYIRSVIHADEHPVPTTLKYPSFAKKNYVFETVFMLTFILAFYLIITRLAAFNYTIVEGVVFLFIFSVANFLGYRLTLHYRDIELVSTDQGFVAIIRNFLYLPFVFVGKRIVKRSEKFNVVALALDIAIDLPLKTVVRLIRQWLTFVQGKKDDM